MKLNNMIERIKGVNVKIGDLEGEQMSGVESKINEIIDHLNSQEKCVGLGKVHPNTGGYTWCIRCSKENSQEKSKVLGKICLSCIRNNYSLGAPCPHLCPNNPDNKKDFSTPTLNIKELLEEYVRQYVHCTMCLDRCVTCEERRTRMSQIISTIEEAIKNKII
jgi:hypothetical protein